jgi:hypothetical protein
VSHHQWEDRVSEPQLLRVEYESKLWQLSSSPFQQGLRAPPQLVLQTVKGKNKKAGRSGAGRATSVRRGS